MFYKNQPDLQKNNYEDYLKTVGSLSNLFSESAIPYLYYRLAEKVFCKAFEADDLSRSDVAIDAKKDGLGIGLKTFLLGNSKSFQKVAEFNADRHLYDLLPTAKKIKKIAELRNERVGFAERSHGLKSSIYHCVVRKEGKFLLYEEKMDYVNISKILITKETKSAIHFNDGNNHYSFSLSKSTLLKKFIVKNPSQEFKVDIFKDPLEEIQKLVKKSKLNKPQKIYKDTVFLPLYGKDKTVFTSSGLNQWNAKGRKRNINETYIPVPALLHKLKPNFFPPRDTHFDLKFPDGTHMKAKICQQGGKALMSDPNSHLGEWILRKVLKFPEGKLLNYRKLEEIGIDSVRIDKINDGTFEINFSALDSYENWVEKVISN
jgi:hypothetical protein